VSFGCLSGDFTQLRDILQSALHALELEPGRIPWSRQAAIERAEARTTLRGILAVLSESQPELELEPEPKLRLVKGGCDVQLPPRVRTTR
jgi:hypothetical protein